MDSLQQRRSRAIVTIMQESTRTLYEMNPVVSRAIRALNFDRSLVEELGFIHWSRELHRRCDLASDPGCACTTAVARGPAAQICLCNSEGALEYRYAKTLNRAMQGMIMRLLWNLEQGEAERPGRIPPSYFPVTQILYPNRTDPYSELLECLTIFRAGACDKYHRVICAHRLTEIQAQFLLFWIKQEVASGEPSQGTVAYLEMVAEDIDGAQQEKEIADRAAAFYQCELCQRHYQESLLDRPVCVCESDYSFCPFVFEKAWKIAAAEHLRIEPDLFE